MKNIKHKLIVWFAEYAYRKANPEGNMDTPSIVYEQVEKDFDRFLRDENMIYLSEEFENRKDYEEMKEKAWKYDDLSK